MVSNKINFLLRFFRIYYFAGLPHPRGHRNDARFRLLTWSTVRLDTDGFAQIEPLTKIVNIRLRSTVTHMKIDVNADRNVNKPPSSLNINDTHGTSTSTTVIRTTTPVK